MNTWSELSTRHGQLIEMASCLRNAQRRVAAVRGDVQAALVEDLLTEALEALSNAIDDLEEEAQAQQP